MADVLEDLHRLHTRLIKVRDSIQVHSRGGDVVGNPPIIRVAAHAAILVYEKYLPRLHECEAYAIAIGKPNLDCIRKVQNWCNGCSTTEVRDKVM
jgi:hypothetical protein